MKQDIIHQILEIDESFKAPGRLMEILFERDKRESVFRQFLDHESDLSYEWLSDYFEEEQADRKTKKQDFTPQSVSELLNALVDGYEVDQEQLYTVKLSNGSVLIKDPEFNSFQLCKAPKEQIEGYEYKLTRSEIESVDPILMGIAKEVE